MSVDTLKRDIENAFHSLDDLVDLSGFLNKKDINEVMDEYFRDCSYLPKMHEFTVMKGYDEATYRHSLRVGVLSWTALKSMRKRYKKEEMAEFCAAGILHDCGKKEVAQEILQTRGSITKEQYEQVKTHADKGVSVMKNILQGDGVNTELIGLIVKYHHEDLNGNGYSNLLDPEKFNGYVQLVAIADIIDSTVCRGIYQHKCDPRDAINFIELASTEKEDNANIEYLKVQIKKVAGNDGKPFFKGAEAGKYDKEYALPYIHLFRNHAR